MKNAFHVVALVILAGINVFAQGPLPPVPPPGSDIIFVSQPPSTGQVNVPYQYTAQAVSRDSTTIIHYGVGRFSPPNFTVDSITGVVTWTPAKKGWYDLSILAFANTGRRAEQQFHVEVAGGNGILKGKVTDGSNLDIQGIVIEVFRTDSILNNNLLGPSDSLTFYIGGCFYYRAMTNADGNYYISGIDPGKYKIHAFSPTFQYKDQWFDGGSDPAHATVITIADSPAVSNADFHLLDGIAKFTVSGTVTDTLQVPLGATVYFVNSGFAQNSNASDRNFRSYFALNGTGDFRLGGSSPQVYRTQTDSLGNYSVKLPEGPYIAYAAAKGYFTEFYNGQSDFLSATPLTIQQDTGNINFALVAIPPVVFGSISGTVLDSVKGIGVHARVIVYRDRWTTPDDGRTARAYTTDTDSLGAYTFAQLPPGTYIVFAVPLGDYAPAFYSTDSINTSWKTATELTIDGNSINNINIYVKEIAAGLNGYVSISGNVKATTASGFMVYARNNKGVLGFSTTDNAGNYSIDGLAPGTYSVSVSKPGYVDPASQVVSVSYSSTGTPHSATASFSISEVTGVVPTTTLQPTTFTLEQNYPNPFNPTTTISYSIAASSRVTLRVFNLLGQEVATLVDQRQNAGSYQVKFGNSNLTSGVYFYQLRVGNNVIQTRRMLLVK